MLLAADLPGAALEEFKPAMNEEPGRFGALFGAAQAAERIGDMDLASSYYQTLLEICERADDEARDSLMHARESIVGNE